MSSTIQFLMNLTLQNKLPKMDDHIHPTLDDYCSFRSLYKKFVSFSSKFGRISHVRIKLPKVEENRFIIFFHYWKRNIPRLLTHYELDLLLLGCIMCTVLINEYIRDGHHKPVKTRHTTITFMHHANEVCKTIFGFLYGLG